MKSEIREALSLIYANAHATADSTPEMIKSLFEEAMAAYEYKPNTKPDDKFEWPDALKD